MTYIYILEKEGVPFYIGKAVDIKRRLIRHRINFGSDIDLHVIDECQSIYEEWRPLEEYWINQFKVWGFNLENKNNGGGGSSQFTEEQKEKHKSYYTEEVKAKMNFTQERKDKISKTLLERNHSKYYTEEVRNKMREKLKGSHGGPFTKSHIRNLTESFRKHKGKKLYQFDLQGNFIREWRSKGEAVEGLKLKDKYKGNLTSQIKDCCFKKQKSAFGYIWSYENNIDNLNINPLIYQFDLDKNLKNTFISRKELVSFIKQERPNSAVDSIATAINRESKLRIYKSGNYYYTIKEKI